jgi:hypothetical protein
MPKVGDNLTVIDIDRDDNIAWLAGDDGSCWALELDEPTDLSADWREHDTGTLLRDEQNPTP